MHDLSNPGDVVAQMCEAGLALSEIRKVLQRAVSNIDYALFCEANPHLSDGQAYKAFRAMENIPY